MDEVPPVARRDPGREEPAAAEPRAVDPRFTSLQRVAGLLGTAVVAAGLLIGLAIVLVAAGPTPGRVLGGTLAWGGLVGGLAVTSYYWPRIEYRHLSYRLDRSGIEIRRGVVWRRTIFVPRNRLQHLDVSQGPLSRQFGLASLLLHTAGTEHARVELPGLALPVANAIREHLVAGEDDDAV